MKNEQNAVSAYDKIIDLLIASKPWTVPDSFAAVAGRLTHAWHKGLLDNDTYRLAVRTVIADAIARHLQEISFDLSDRLDEITLDLLTEWNPTLKR